MKENLLVLNRNIESEDIDSIALAIKKLSTSSENQFNGLKNERWFNRLFNMITFSNKKNIRLAEQINTLAQAQEILIRVLLLLSEKSSEISELVKNNTKDIEKLGENDIYLLNRIKKLEDKIFGIKREIKLEDLSLQAKEILSACLKKLSTLFDYTSDNQKLYVNFILNQLNIDRVEYNNLELAIDELDSNNEKTQILISCLEYIYLKNNNFNILKTNYQILNFIEMFYFSEKKIDEIKNQVERDSNFDGIIFRYGNDYNEDFDDAFLLDFIDDIEETKIEKEDLYIDSMFNIKEGEICIIENKNIHISSMINCSGTLEIRNCTLYYNETENSPNRINLDGNYSFKIEDSTVICKNYNKEFFIRTNYKSSKNTGVYFKNTNFEDCLNYMNIDAVNVTIDKCKFLNCLGGLLYIFVYGDFLIANCSITQENLPNFKIEKESFFMKDTLFDIVNCNKKEEHFFKFINNKIDIYFYNESVQYSKIISCYKNLIVMNSSFNNYLKDHNKKNLILHIDGRFIDSCSFYSLSKIFDNYTKVIDNCYFENCSFIHRWIDIEFLLCRNTEFKNCNNSLFPSSTGYNKFSSYKKGYSNVIWFENCKFSGNSFIDKNFIALGAESKIEKCEFSNINVKNFLISTYIHEKDSTIPIRNCIFKNCGTERRDREIIEKYGLVERIFRDHLTYKMVEIINCSFI